jgi:molybdopterin/thiamine biosynthesis adenylyltransferase
MTRKTSAETYQQIIAEGYISAKRLEVYKTIYKHGQMTSAEAFLIINQNKPKKSALDQSRARFTELRDMGVLEEVCERFCKVTGRKVIVWGTTDNLPIKLPKKASKQQRKKKCLDGIVWTADSIKAEKLTNEQILQQLRSLYRLVEAI